jgi:hypothetical protein
MRKPPAVVRLTRCYLFRQSRVKLRANVMAPFERLVLDEYLQFSLLPYNLLGPSYGYSKGSCP